MASEKVIAILGEVGKEYGLKLELKWNENISSHCDVIRIAVNEGSYPRFEIFPSMSKLHFRTLLDGIEVVHEDTSVFPLLKVGEWVSFEFSQRFINDHFQYMIKFNSTVLYEKQNDKPAIFTNVTVYASFLCPQPGSIRKFTFRKIN